jgi:hypothetical protein
MELSISKQKKYLVKAYKCVLLNMSASPYWMIKVKPQMNKLGNASVAEKIDNSAKNNSDNNETRNNKSDDIAIDEKIFNDSSGILVHEIRKYIAV